MAYSWLVSEGFDLAGDLFGSGGGSVDQFQGELCPGQPPTADVELMLERASSSEVRELDRQYGKFNQGESFGNDAGQLAFAAMGGSDCVYSNPDKSLEDYFWQMMDKYVYEYDAGVWSALSNPWSSSSSSSSSPMPSSSTVSTVLLVVVLAVGGLLLWRAFS